MAKRSKALLRRLLSFEPPGPNVINKFQQSVTIICGNEAHLLDGPSHVAYFSQSKCFISA